MRRPNLSMVKPPLYSVHWWNFKIYIQAYIKEPKKAPPEKVLLMAPMMDVLGLVSKKARKLGDWMTSVITPFILVSTLNWSSADLNATYRIISKQERARSGENRQGDVEELAHAEAW
jgi:hypothetical protein